MIIEALRNIYPSGDSSLVKVNPGGFSVFSIRPQGKDFQLIVTEGLAAKPQEVPEKAKGFEYIELYMCLPDYWDFEKKPWPLDWLERIATVPQKKNTWFGPGDTLPAGNPPKPLDDQLQAEYFILSEPILLKTDLEPMTAEKGTKLLAIIPLFKGEFDFKIQNSARELFDKFEKNGVTELIDTYRKPAARKRFMGVF